MSQEKISQLEKGLESQNYKIQSIEKTIDVLFPPLIEQLKKVSSNLSANTQALTKNTVTQEHLSQDVKELKDSSVKQQDQISTIKTTQAGHAVVISALKGIGMKIFASTITVVIAAAGVVIALIKNTPSVG